MQPLSTLWFIAELRHHAPPATLRQRMIPFLHDFPRKVLPQSLTVGQWRRLRLEINGKRIGRPAGA
jgi:hypothetical protein